MAGGEAILKGQTGDGNAGTQDSPLPAPHPRNRAGDDEPPRGAQRPGFAAHLRPQHRLDAASQDDQVKVIILSGEGPHFSAGHDMRGGSGATMHDFKTVGTWANFDQPGAEGPMAREEEIYLGMCRRWRTIPKPMIAEVQGKVIAGGLMLIW